MRHTLTKSRLSRNLGVIAAATLAFSLAACSAPSSTEKTPAATDDGALETTELLIGIVPVIDHASVFVAIDEGFFDEEGLSVTAQPAQGGAAAVPAMIAGEMQGAFATYPSFMLAQNSGIGINIVAEGVRGTAETAGVYVAKDSPVQDISDLAGKKIAVNTLNNTGDLTIKTLLSEAGVDLGSVEFIELGFADMMPTLANGGVDAAWLVEPFQTAALGEGARKIFATYEGTTDGIPVSGIGMTEAFVTENPNTTAAFVRAIERANELIAEDPKVARDILPSYSKVTPEVAAQLQAPAWSAGSPDVEALEAWNKIMTDQGALDAPVDLKKMVWTAK